MARILHDDYEFSRIYKLYNARVYGYLLKIVKSPYTAEEITQEIFLKLWLCRDTISHINNMDGYIFKIAKNHALNCLRKAASDLRLLNELQKSMVQATNNVDERLILAEYEKIQNEALTKLSPQRRLVYQLSRREGLNYEEIADRLNLSKNTVRNHMVSALHFMREHFNKNGTDLFLVLIFFLLS